MTDTLFRVETSIDGATGRVVAAYLRVREGEVTDTREVEEGRAYADYDARGLLLGLELLGPCQAAVLKVAAEHEPVPVKQFLTGAAPRAKWWLRKPSRAHRRRPQRDQIRPHAQPRQAGDR